MTSGNFGQFCCCCCFGANFLYFHKCSLSFKTKGNNNNDNNNNNNNNNSDYFSGIGMNQN